jgi:hypothetical protein
MKKCSLLAAVATVSLVGASAHAEKMQFGWLWHMHQPFYYPGETLMQTQNANRYSFSVVDVHNQRFGPYTNWPRNAVQSGLSYGNLGAQVSLSGSLIQNLNNLRDNNVNGGMWNNWQGAYVQAKNWQTNQGNTRMDMIGFNYTHGLGPLLDERDVRMQIKLHKQITTQTFGGTYSKGYFPAETAFSTRMIPWLKAEGIEWTLYDSIHHDRASKNYPHTNASGLFAPNRADQVNPDPTTNGGAWVQLNNLWAPSRVSTESYRPAQVQHVNPNTGAISKIVGVPAARYEGNEDGRGGYGAFLYGTVMDQYRSYNTNNARPMFVMLHHDGDNYGGGSEGYYNGNFSNMVNWLNGGGNQNYNPTTVQDYLSRFPVPQNAVVHVANGSWAGADSGDVEFKKWLADPNAAGWSPDRNSWAVLTAAKNRVYTAEDAQPIGNLNNVINLTGNSTERAWGHLVQAQASDYWYWDGTEIWDSAVTRGSNLAVTHANNVLTSAVLSNETTPPSVFHPQRDAYNPGEYEFGANRENADFKIWTYAYDVSGLQSVTLKFRVDVDGENPLGSTQNETFAGGAEVGTWQSLTMGVQTEGTRPGNILAPTVRAEQFAATIAGQRNVLLDYYVEAIDGRGNITKSDIQHVWVGQGSGGPNPGGDFVMDGILDAGVSEIANQSGVKIHLQRKGGKLYLATNDAGEGNDHFLYVSRNPTTLVAANWAKAGQVTQWDSYMADETSNDWEGWFDAPANAPIAAGTGAGVLEGVLDMVAEYGFVPSTIHVAMAAFANNDGGPLQFQLPASTDGNLNLNPGEFLAIQLGQGFNGITSNNYSTASNWFDGVVPNAVGAHAQFLSHVPADMAVVRDSNVTVGRITFDSDKSVTLAGTGTLTIDVASGNAAINVNQNNHAIAMNTVVNDNTTITVGSGFIFAQTGALTVANGSTITTGGAGVTQFSGAIASSANARLVVNGGGMRAQTDLNGLRVDVNAGEARFDVTQNLSGLTVASGAVATVTDNGSMNLLKTTSLSVSGTLNLNDNAIIVDYTGATPALAIGAMIDAGHNNGTWTGNGIYSPFAGANPLFSIGWLDTAAAGATTFVGANVDASSILIRFTLSGDTDLDGTVGFADLLSLAQNYGMSGSAIWHQGDTDYNGAIDFADLLTMAQNYNQNLIVGGRLIDMEIGNATFQADWAMLRAMVPEPTVSVVAVGLAGIASRRLRRKVA